METQGYQVGNDDELEFVTTARRVLSTTSAQLFLVLAAVALAYGHTLDVPLYFDDFSSLRDNPAIRDWTNPGAVYAFAQQRFVAYYTFALNYGVGLYDVFGYHLVNTLIHFAAGSTLYFLTRALLNTPAIAPHASEVSKRWLPLCVALLFVLHPLQIQAVTYIVQRAASMAALFLLLSTYFYIRGRLVPTLNQRALAFALCGFAALLALFSKQNTVVLPLVLFLVEVIFFQLQGRRLLAVLGAGAGSVLLLVGVYYFFIDQNFFETLSRATQETVLVTRFEYLAVQMGVLWTYIFKFFVPLSLHLDYDIPVTSFADWQTLLFAVGHLALITGAVFVIRKRPMLAFGILFYYTAHLVESSIIPIRDFAVEHRTYLPNVGLVLVVIWSLLNILTRFVDKRAVFAGIGVLIVVFGALTWQRNQVWRDPIAFFTHETEMSPEMLRPWSMLGENYLYQERNEEAVDTYFEAAPLVNTSANRKTNTELAYYANFVLALERVGRDEEALTLLERIGIDRIEDPEDKSLFLGHQGMILAQAERFAEADEILLEATQLNPRNLNAQVNYAKLQMLKGDVQKAREIVVEVLDYDPSHVEARATLELLDTL